MQAHEPYIIHKRDQGNASDDTINRLLCIVEAQQKSIADLIKQNQHQHMKQQLQQLSFQRETEKLANLIDKLNEKVDTRLQTAASTITKVSTSKSTTAIPTPKTSVTKSTTTQKTTTQQKSLESSKAKTPQKQRKRVEIFGDSMIGGVKGQYMSAKNNFKIHSYGGGTSEDMLDLVRIGMRRKPEIVILHSGTNDVTSEINTLDMLEKTVDFIKSENEATNVAISLVLSRNDQHKNKNSEIKDINNKIKTFCRQRSIGVIEHSSFDVSCLSQVKNTAYGKRGGLHPNPKGNAVLAKDFVNYVDSL